MSLLDDYVDGTAGLQSNLAEESLSRGKGVPLFQIEQVTLPGPVNMVHAVVKDNILVLALKNYKLMKIDLSRPTEIIDIDLPKSKSDASSVYRIFLDNTGRHLLVSMLSGDNYYIHEKLSKPHKLGKLKGSVEEVAWNDLGTVHTTKEILIGCTNGLVYESWLEPNEGFNRVVERYTRQLYQTTDNQVVRGLHLYRSPVDSKTRHALLSTKTSILHFRGIAVSASGTDASLPGVFAQNIAGVQEFSDACEDSMLCVADDLDEIQTSNKHFAWLASTGILHGGCPASEPGDSSFEESRLIARHLYALEPNTRSCIELSRYHILVLTGSLLQVYNRYDDKKVFQERIPAPDSILGMMADPVQQTYWAYSETQLYEIVINEETRDMWNIFLNRKEYDKALSFALNDAQSNMIRQSQASTLMSTQHYDAAARLFAKTSTPIEKVALTFLDLDEKDALRLYLLQKLETYKKGAEMQRTMLCTWLIELFMNKMNALDDVQNVAGNLRKESASQSSIDLQKLSLEYANFIAKYKNDLDREATYALINTHGREDELLVYANSIDDYQYVVNYWIQKDDYKQALKVLQKNPDEALSYSLSSILLPEIPSETVEMWMRQPMLDPRKLLPAILTYNDRCSLSIEQNQSVRYLLFTIKNGNTDTTVHNTLLSIYARDSDKEETALIQFLARYGQPPRFDPDFGLRICKHYNRVLSCVKIYSSMALHDQAVEFALENDDVDLAGEVADQVEDNHALRKKLWLMIAKKTISQPDGMKKAIEMSKKNDVLRIEDLVPHFTDFTIIDDFGEEICSALESYSDSIDSLRKEMDDSSKTAETINKNIESLKNRFAVVRVGEQCYSCRSPLLLKQFYVFPCQHTFHADCLVQIAGKESSTFQRRRIAQLQTESAQASGTSTSLSKRTKQDLTEELDDIIAAECPLCGNLMIKSIEEGFTTKEDKAEMAEANSWTL